MSVLLVFARASVLRAIVESCVRLGKIWDSGGNKQSVLAGAHSSL